MLNLDEFEFDDPIIPNTPPTDDIKDDPIIDEDATNSDDPNIDDIADQIDIPEPDPEPEEADPLEIEGYIKSLKEYGFLELPDDYEIKTTKEGLDEAMETSKKTIYSNIANSIWESLPEDFRPLFEYGLNGGTSIQDYVKTFQDNSIESLSAETEEGQEKVLYTYYKTTSNYTDDKIQRLVSSLKASGDLEAEAKDSLEELKTFQEERRTQLITEQAEAKKAADDALAAQQAELANSIDQTQLEEKRKNKIKSMFFSPLEVKGEKTTYYNYVINNITTNKEHLIQFADILLDYDLKKGFNLEPLTKKAKSEAAKDLRNILSKSLDPKAASSGGRLSKQTDTFDWDAFIRN